MGYIQNTIQPYLEYMPYFALTLLFSFLLTPLIGFLAKKLKILDIPASLRKPTDTSKKTRLKKKLTPRAGVVAVIIPFIIMMTVTGDLNKQIIAIILGVLILLITGIVDDRYEIERKYQFLFQLIAALIVISVGISIDSIQMPFGTSINLRWLVIPFNLFANQYSIALPADIITIIWILIMMNAMNWIFGIDGLGEGVTIISFIAILLISVKLGNLETALMASIMAGGLMGFLPFNINPSKIIGGTAVVIYGFLIAVLSILGGVKVSTSVIVLAIPIIDMVWVMVGRINRAGVTNFFDVFKVTTIGDDTHLHHRLLKLGLSEKKIAYVEWLAVGICAVIAFASADLPKVTIITIIVLIVLFGFSFVSYLLKKGFNLKRKNEPQDPKGGDKDDVPESPESRYAY